MIGAVDADGARIASDKGDGNVAPGAGGAGIGLAARLRAATQPAHRLAEHSGFMRDLLQGRVHRGIYCLLLRNLHALYEALEAGLDRHADAPAVAPLRFPACYRTAPLARDLALLHGPGWDALPCVPAMHAHVARITQLSAQQPTLLAAHAYVRYLGDMSGGQLLAGIVRRALALDEHAGTAFYRFDEDVGAMKKAFRASLDALPVDAATADDIVAEAIDAFARHVILFDELETTPLARP